MRNLHTSSTIVEQEVTPVRPFGAGKGYKPPAHDTFRVSTSVDELDSGKFQLTVSVDEYRPDAGTFHEGSPSKWRARSIEELVPLSARDYGNDVRSLIRNAVYSADDSYGGYSSKPIPAPPTPEGAQVILWEGTEAPPKRPSKK